jgi:hypothetical protein
MGHGQNLKFQHVWNMSWSKSSVSAWLEYVVEKKSPFQLLLEYVKVTTVSFSLSEMSHGSPEIA